MFQAQMKVDGIDPVGADDGRKATSERLRLSVVAGPGAPPEGSVVVVVNDPALVGTFKQGQLFTFTLEAADGSGADQILRRVEAAPGTPGFDEKVAKGLITHEEGHAVQGDEFGPDGRTSGAAAGVDAGRNVGAGASAVSQALGEGVGPRGATGTGAEYSGTERRTATADRRVGGTDPRGVTATNRRSGSERRGPATARL